MAIKSVADLKDHLFLSEIRHPPRKDPYEVIALVYFRNTIDHLIF